MLSSLSSFGAAESGNKTAGGDSMDDRPRTKPPRMPLTKMEAEDIRMREELVRTRVRLGQAFDEWRNTPLPADDNMFAHLNETQGRRLGATLANEFDQRAVDMRRNEERARQLALLERVGEYVASNIPARDGTKRRIEKIAESPALQRGMARYFRMHDLLNEKQKLVFMRNTAQDRADHVAWSARTDEYYKRFICGWLFGDEEGLYRRVEDEIRLNAASDMGTETAKSVALLHQKILVESLGKYIRRRTKTSRHFSLGTKDGVVDDDSDDDDVEHQNNSAFYKIVDEVRELSDMSGFSLDATIARGLSLCERLHEQENAKIEALYLKEKITMEERANSRNYISAFVDYSVTRFKKRHANSGDDKTSGFGVNYGDKTTPGGGDDVDDDDDKTEWEKFQKELEEKYDFTVESIRKSISRRTFAHLSLLMLVTGLCSFTFGRFSHIHYSLTPEMESVKDSLANVEKELREGSKTLDGITRDVEAAASSFSLFAIGVKQVEGLFQVKSGADMNDPAIMCVVRTQIRDLIKTATFMLDTTKTTEAATLSTLESYRLLRDDMLQPFLDASSMDDAYNMLRRIRTHLNIHNRLAEKLQVSQEKLLGHIDDMTAFFGRLYPSIRETAAHVKKSVSVLNKEGFRLEDVVDKMQDDDYNAGCVRAMLDYMCGEIRVDESLMSHILNNSSSFTDIFSPSQIFGNMATMPFVNAAIATEVRAKRFYRSLAYPKWVGMGDLLSMLGYLFTGYMNPFWVCYYASYLFQRITWVLPVGVADIVPDFFYRFSTWVQGTRTSDEDLAVQQVREANKSEQGLKDSFEAGEITLRVFCRAQLPSDATENAINVNVAQHGLRNQSDIYDGTRSLIKTIMSASSIVRFGSLVASFSAIVSTISVAMLGYDLAWTGVPIWVAIVLLARYNYPKAVAGTSAIMSVIKPVTVLYDWYRSHPVISELALLAVACSLPLFARSETLAPYVHLIGTVTQANSTSPEWYNESVNYLYGSKNATEQLGQANVNFAAFNSTLNNASAYVKDGHLMQALKFTILK